MESKKEKLRIYKIKLNNTLKRLEDNNYDNNEIEVLNKRIKVYTQEIERLEEELK